MATESGEDHAEHEEGGPVKPFLEHLEDLRWVLIKSLVVTAIGMIICLIGANYLIGAIKLPLEKADKLLVKKTQSISLFVGTNVLGTFHFNTNHWGEMPLSSNWSQAFQLSIVPSTTNYLLAVQPVTNQTLLAMTKKRTVLRNYTPIGGFWVAFQIALYGGIVLAAPFIIYFVAQFILPALKYKEKKHGLQGFSIGTVLFMTGVCFCYFFLLPMALQASVRYSEWLGFGADEWRAEDYISFVCKFMLGMGLGFELPVVILTLVKVGILNYRMLAGFRRYMIVINLILGAVLTTPEVITQVLMFIPLQLLYELSIWVAWYWERRDRKRAGPDDLASFQ